MLDKDEVEITHSAAASVQALRADIGELNGKIARITDLIVEQDIEREEYLNRKRALMSQKRSLEEQVLLLERDAARWLEPMREWLIVASGLAEAAQSNDLPSRKSLLQKIFGSNLTLHSREARGMPENPWFFIRQAKSNLPESDPFLCMVPGVRIELTRPCGHSILSRGCLPVSAPGPMTPP